ncbi:MAG: DUF3126 family protein [Alphaproteobacteria bacterium]
MANFTPSEITRLQAYMQTTFNNPKIYLKARKNADSLEVDINGEFIGTIYKDEEDGETSFDFNMAILAVDLPGEKAA